MTRPPPAETLRRAAAELARGEPVAALMALDAIIESRAPSPRALALRGVALAQLGEHQDALHLLDRAERAARRARLPLDRARALAAAAEVAVALRDVRGARRRLAAAERALDSVRDRRNAAWTRVVHARLAALCGDIAGARGLLRRAGAARARDATLSAAIELAHAELAARAGAFTATVRLAAHTASIPPSLRGERARFGEAVRTAVATARCGGVSRPLDAPATFGLLRGERAATRAATGGAAHALVVDAIARRIVAPPNASVDLRRRPVSFAVVAALARRWPFAATWMELNREASGFDETDASARRRVAVEIDRLRGRLPRGVRVVARGGTFRLAPPAGTTPVLLSLAAPSAHDAIGDLVVALLGDGARWSVPDLAFATGASVRTVQRALASLAATGAVVREGRARAARHAARDPAGIASQMLVAGLLDPRNPGRS